MPQTILFVEDEPDYGLIISTALEENGYTVYWIDNLDQLAGLLRTKQIELLLLDLEVKDQNSLSEIPTIHRQYPKLPILIASSHTQGKEISECLAAGARQYIKKPYDIDEILYVLKTHLPDIREIGTYRLMTATHQLWDNATAIKLTPKEYKLLCILADRKGEVIKREQLFQEIWEGEEQEDSLNNLIAHLRRYLKKDKQIRLDTIKHIGYCLSFSPPPLLGSK